MSSPRFTPHDLHKLAPKLGFEMEGECPVPTKRRPRNNEESRSQQAVIKWWQMACRGFGVPEILLFAIPNGGGRSGPVVGAILKREGLRTGAPDLMLAVPRGHTKTSRTDALGNIITDVSVCCAIFIEMKTSTGVVSPEQEVFHEHLRARGYRVEVCRSAREAIECISAYLK